ncbi:MAG TPA: SAM hydroxide adenosyltransferase, partial [Gemmataceae bacterium]|nr:SAM hydroxide adenosyltransferase [Gemmataceae bacterium]
AACVSVGTDPAGFGPVADHWKRLEMPAVSHLADGYCGEVIFVDHFGNLITNILGALVKQQATQLVVADQPFPEFVWVRTYADAKPGQLLALVSGSGFVEVAIAQGNAAERLGARTGAKVILRWEH